VCPDTGENFSMIIPNVNTHNMNLYINELSNEYPNYRIILTMDNASWHTCKEIEKPENITLWNIPPYSPELNPAEHLWHYIRETKKFNNRTFDSIQEVEEHLAIALKEMQTETEIIKSLTNFNWLY